jgi:hypothetical protein
MKRLTIPPEIINCIKEGRAPEPWEVRSVADHIWSDIKGRGFLGDARSQGRHLTIRAAQTALTGCAG